MRSVVLLAIAACGHVESQATPDAAPGCPMHLANPMPPMWVDGRGFTLVDDPARTHGLVWASNGAAPSGSFAVGFSSGDRITGIAFDARGNVGAGLRNIAVTYGGQTLATADDLGRAATWGSVTLAEFRPAVLTDGQVLVTFDTVGTGYLIGRVTAELDRACR